MPGQKPIGYDVIALPKPGFYHMKMYLPEDSDKVSEVLLVAGHTESYSLLVVMRPVTSKPVSKNSERIAAYAMPFDMFMGNASRGNTRMGTYVRVENPTVIAELEDKLWDTYKPCAEQPPEDQRVTVEPGFYRHWKHDPRGETENYTYEVLSTAQMLGQVPEHLAIYRPLYKLPALDRERSIRINAFARPIDMFFRPVPTKKGRQSRFERITDPRAIQQLEVVRDRLYRENTILNPPLSTPTSVN